MSASLISLNRSALKVQLHLRAGVDYIDKLSHYSFDAGVAKLNKGIKVRELAVLNQFGYCNLSGTANAQMLEILEEFYRRTALRL